MTSGDVATLSSGADVAPGAVAGPGDVVAAPSARDAAPGEGQTSRADRMVEIAAVVLLAAGTLLAAWSGYQSAIWNGVQAGDYVKGSGERVESTKSTTQAGQDRLYDSQVFSQWLNASDAGKTKLAAIYERRFRPEFRVAFQAWLKTDPFNDPNAPPGPLFMSEYVQATAQQAAVHEAQATALIAAGEEANDDGDRYVLLTVIFATVIVLAAVADRFKWRVARVGALSVGYVLLAGGAVSLLQLPIA